MTGRTLATLLLALLIAAPCAAQTEVRPTDDEGVCFPEHSGPWRGATSAATGGSAYGLTPVQSRLFLARMDSLAAELHRLPVFNPALGFRTEVSTDFCCSYNCQRDGSCRTRPPYGRIWMLLEYFYAPRAGGRPITFVERRAEAEFFFNNPWPIFDNEPVIRLPDQRRVAFQPQPFRKIGGVQFYQNARSGDVYAYFTHERPVWLPFSQEQYLTAILHERDSTMAQNYREVPMPEMRAKLDQVKAILVDAPRQQLARMSPAERAAQAWVASPGEPPVAPSSPYARPLVVFNPDYFDRALPRTDIQLVVVRLEGLNLDTGLPDAPAGRPFDLISRKLKYCSDISGLRLWELANQLDWTRVQALVK